MEKDRDAENEGNRKSRKRMGKDRSEGEEREGAGGREEAHSSTTLHYVRHFPEDSLGSENREDVGKRQGEVRRSGSARGRPNKYLTKSSGKLIPSLGRLLREGSPTFSCSIVDDAPERASERTRVVDGTVRVIFFARFPRADRWWQRNHVPKR